MKIKINKSKTYLRFRDKNVRGKIYYDGSGYLEVLDKNNQEYCREDAKHEHRVSDIKRLYFLYKNAYQQLKKVKYIKVLNK